MWYVRTGSYPIQNGSLSHHGVKGMKWGVRHEEKPKGRAPAKDKQVLERLKNDQQHVDDQGGYVRLGKNAKTSSLTNKQYEEHRDRMSDAVNKVFPTSSGSNSGGVREKSKQLVKDPTGKNRDMRVDVMKLNGELKYIVYDKTTKDYVQLHKSELSMGYIEDSYSEDELQDLIDKYGESGWDADMVYERQFKENFKKSNVESQEKSKELQKRLGKSKVSQLGDSIRSGAKKAGDVLKSIGSKTFSTLGSVVESGRNTLKKLFKK